MTAHADLLRRIEDAIEAHATGWPSLGEREQDPETGPAVLRAVLDAGWRPTDRDLLVCPACHGAATIDTGESYRPWCRDCNGTGYVERTAP